MHHFATTTPGFRILASVTFAVIVAQFASLFVAFRQGRRKIAVVERIEDSTGTQSLSDRPRVTWPLVVLTSTWVFVPATAAHLIAGARARLIAAHFATEGVADTPRWSMLDQPNIICCAVIGAVLAAMVAAVALAITIGSRTRCGQRRLARWMAALPVLFVMFVMLPFAAGMWTYSARLLHTCPPFYQGDWLASCLAGAVEAKLSFAIWANRACAGLAIVAALAGILLGTAPPRCVGKNPSWLPAICLCASAALVIFFAGTRLRKENQSPWPPLSNDVLRAWGRRVPLHVPVLVGPDALIRAPTLEIGQRNPDHPDDVEVGGSGPLDTVALRERLQIEMRTNPLVHPDGPNDALDVLCAPEVQPTQLAAVLKIAKEIGYRSISFGCVYREETRRPILGLLSRRHMTAVNASLESAPSLELRGEAPAIVHFNQHSTFESLARTIATLRRVGKKIVLDLSP